MPALALLACDANSLHIRCYLQRNLVDTFRVDDRADNPMAYSAMGCEGLLWGS